MTKISKKIILIGGDPNSINSEIIYKSWRKLERSIRNKIYIIANYELLKKQFSKLNYRTKLNKIKDLNQACNENEINIINVDLNFKKPFNVEKKAASSYLLNCLNLAHKLALKKEIAGLVNCPVDKGLLLKKKIGVTEYLANKCKIKNNSEVMMIHNKKLSICPITTHLDLKDVPKNIKSKKIVLKIKTIQKCFKKLFKKNAKIGVLGLNPHNAELRKNSEEVDEIIPAIKNLKKLGYKVFGPLVSDTIFINNYRKYDVIVGMYHDQVLTPFKSIFKFEAINLTLGLEYLRVSPDHGVAKDIIKKNKANFQSLLECIKFINKFG